MSQVTRGFTDLFIDKLLKSKRTRSSVEPTLLLLN